MPTFALTVRLCSPLAVQAERGTGNESSMPSAVPATTVRGALAALFDEAGALTSEDVRAAVLGEQGLRTSALVPAPAGTPGAVVRPAPLTLQSCKLHPGFRGDGQHGVEDGLLALLRYALDDDEEGLRALLTCPRCGTVLRPHRRPVGRTADGTWTSAPEPARRVHVHAGRDRRRRGAAQGALYAREMLSEQPEAPSGDEAAATRMQALVTASGPAEDLVRRHLTPGATLRMGHARSRGLGRCRVEAVDEHTQRASVRERLERFDAAARDYGLAAEGPLVVLTCTTPALFVGPFLRPLTAPGGDALLQAATEDEQPHAEALAALTPAVQQGRPYRLRAWNGLARAPHATDQGLSAGTVLAFRAPEVTGALVRALEHVEARGVGLRRHLGLGRVTVCDPIHTDVHELTAAAAAA